MWGDPETISEKLIRRQLEWLGHLVCKGDNRTPKMGGFPKKQTLGGQRKRWRGVVKTDLQDYCILGAPQHSTEINEITCIMKE